MATSATPTNYGASVTFTATPPAGTAGTITFYDGATQIGTGSIAGGVATLTTATLSVGSHSITASWPGNVDYTSGTSSILTETISRVAANVAVTSSLNPSLYGNTVVVTVTLTGTGAATPTGTVTLNDGATTLGTLTLNGSGIATGTMVDATAGSHVLLATYNGDGNYF
jgi:hypothetical protein